MKKTKMKKMIALMMSVLLLFGLAACGNEKQGAGSGQGNSSSESADGNVSEPEKTEEPKESSSVSETEGASGTDETVSNPENGAGTESTENGAGTENAGGKTLVVYYSASGNTEEAAGYIASATGADLFELEPKEAYTDADLDWTDEDSRVCREHENEEERNIELASATVPDWDSYETVFIGYAGGIIGLN